MAGLADFRKKHPQYDDMSDAALSDALYKKFYSDMPRPDFDAKMGVSASDPEPEQKPREMGITEYAMQAVPFGDEVAAAAAATGRTLGKALSGKETDWSGDYEAARTGDKAAREQIEADRPVATTLAQGAGIAAIGAPLAGAKNAAFATGLPGQIWQGIKGGAAIGGAVGAGEGEGLEERLHNAKWGAALGGGIGGAAPALISGIRGGTSIVGKMLPTNAIRARTNPNAVADDMVMSRLAADDVAPEAVAARLQRAQDAGSPMAMVDVAGGQTQRLARAVSNLGGRGGERINTFVAARKLDQPERVMENIRKAVGDPNAFTSTLDDVIRTRQELAKPLYDAAYAKPFKPSAAMGQALTTPAAQTALRRASDMSLNEGIEFALDVRGLDLVKRSLDDMIGSAVRSGETNQARILGGLRDRIVKEVDAAVPEYKQARQVFSDGKAVEGAMEKGLTALKAQPDQLRREVAAMTSGEKDVFRLGFARALSDTVKATPDGRSLVSKLFGTQKARDLVRTAFPDSRSFKEFRTLMMREARMARTAQSVQGNSTTAQQMGDMADVGQTLRTLRDLGTGNWGQAAIDVFGRAFAGARGMNEQTIKRIVDVLTSQDPVQIQQMVQAIKSRKELAGRFDFAMRHLQRLITNEGTAGGTRALAN